MFSSLEELKDDWGGGSGGGTGGTGTGTSIDTTLEEFLPDASGILAVPFGKHLIAGKLLYNKYSAGPPASSIFGVGLWDGEGDSVVRATYAGEDLASSPDGTTVGYHFHRGKLSTGVGDSVQGVDSFTTNGLTFSGTGNIFIKLPNDMATEDRPDKFRGIFKCMRVPNYNINGYETDAGSYSVSPARVVAWAARERGLLARIDWVSWVAWRDYCDAAISWNRVADTVNIARFEANPVWLDRFHFRDVLYTCGLLSGTTPQDDGTLIGFKLPNDQKSVHHFVESKNIVPDSFRPVPDKLRHRVNRLKVNFRDTDNEYLKPITLTIERQELIEQYGPIEQDIALANMNQSQARRLATMMLKLTSDYPNRAELSGFPDSLHILPGDYVLVSTPTINGWDAQLCRVERAVLHGLGDGRERKSFTVKRIDGAVYADTDHAPRQVEVTPT